MSNYRKFAEELTGKVIAMLESGEAPPWQKPWDALSHRNPVSGLTFKGNGSYQGGNPLVLSIVAMFHGWESKYWATYKQIAEHGGRVENQRGTSVVYWGRVPKKKNGQIVKDDDGKEVWVTVSKVFTVYNFDQLTERGTLDALVAKYEKKYMPKGAGTNNKAEEILKNLPESPHFVDGNGRAWYQPATDEIGLPEKATFHGTEEWYATILHELAHWTGHESRLKRDLKTWFASPAYSFEELIAEITAAIIASVLGFSGDLKTNSAAYIRGWLAALKDEPTWLPKATTQAVYAVKYLLEGEKPTFLEEAA